MSSATDFHFLFVSMEILSGPPQSNFHGRKRNFCVFCGGVGLVAMVFSVAVEGFVTFVVAIARASLACCILY